MNNLKNAGEQDQLGQTLGSEQSDHIDNLARSIDECIRVKNALFGLCCAIGIKQPEPKNEEVKNEQRPDFIQCLEISPSKINGTCDESMSLINDIRGALKV